MNIVESALGHYEPHGLINAADVIVGHSFGTSITPKSPNGRLAAFIERHADGRAIVADYTLVQAMSDPEIVDLVVGAPEDPDANATVSNTLGTKGGTWGVLLAAQEFMHENNLRHPLQVAQAHHIGRISMQANKLGMRSVIPLGLPHNFDHKSRQWWTWNLAFWMLREVPGAWELRRQGQL